LLDRLPHDPARENLVAAVHRQNGLLPNLDFALVAMTRALQAPQGTAFAVFAVGRSVGWLAHYFEHLQEGKLIRPRATYVGPLPSLPQAVPRGRVFRFR
jgi:citrate synthase